VEDYEEKSSSQDLSCFILGSIGFIRIWLWQSISGIYGPYWLSIAFVVMFSLIGVVMWGTLSGSMLPCF
jgi:magnesium transporter